MLSITQNMPPASYPTLPPAFPRDRFIRLPEVIHTTGLSRSTIYDLISRQQFPAQISLGGKNVAWLASEIDGWMNDRIAARVQGTVQ
ncbi:helix-turn-helix transcriptional regulator [Yersinia intermedia]|uniref:helix-turn-helix transcriptional regulator n=1 Tax=Yersinia intermedia TaxID=631 RepID=UPI0005E010ED|nr:AlpA family transcriptional regulator [Yersinia intermedia]CNH85690.1 AlpA family transcriptional regulator [Yersinia intermedia]